MPKVMLCFRLDEDDIKAIRVLAERYHVTVTDILRLALYLSLPKLISHFRRIEEEIELELTRKWLEKIIKEKDRGIM